jgi:hypothetical protein
MSYIQEIVSKILKKAKIIRERFSKEKNPSPTPVKDWIERHCK